MPACLKGLRGAAKALENNDTRGMKCYVALTRRYCTGTGVGETIEFTTAMFQAIVGLGHTLL